MKPIEVGRVSQSFGPSRLTVEPTMHAEKGNDGTWRRCKPSHFSGARKYDNFHPGIDIACPVGTPVRAPEDGVVVRKRWYSIWNPFQRRMVQGLYGQFRYGKRILHVDHLSACKPEGTKVKKGERWARTGNSGASSGPHVHLEDRASPDPSASWSAFRRNPELAKVLK